MEQGKTSSLLSRMLRSSAIMIVISAVLFSFPLYAGANLWYGESKGPFKNWMQVLDWDTDGDLDLIVSHTRWEEVDISWAGIGQWINRGDGSFELLRDRGDGTYPFGGFAAAAGDVDQDGDLDIFTQDFGIHLHVNQGGLQAGEPGKFKSLGGINAPPAYNRGYRDMGGTIELGDFNGDSRVDAFVAGCCYGEDIWEPGNDLTKAPSISWLWLNDGREGNLQTGHILPLDFLDGRPIRQVAPGDLDGDGDLDLYVAFGKPTIGVVDSLNDLILLNDGTGRFMPLEQPLEGTDSTSVALGDVNGDGSLDALVGTSDGAVLWLNRGVATDSSEPLFASAGHSFQAEKSIGFRLGALFSTVAEKLLGLYLPYGSVRTQSVFLADLDRDGDLDACLSRLWAAEIWWNDGRGEFSRSDLRFPYREDTGVAVADFDGDGDPDIFIGRNEDDYQVLWNDGKGMFIKAKP